MAPPPASNNGENLDADNTVAELTSIPGGGQLLQNITSLQSQLSVVSRRQDELMHIVCGLREQSAGPAIPAGAGGGPSASNYGRMHVPEQLHNLPPHTRPVPGQPVSQQQVLLSQARVQGPGQPYPDPNAGPRMRPLAPPQRFHPPMPVFSQLHNGAGRVVGLVHQGTYSFADRSDSGYGVERVPPPMYPQTRAQMPPQMIAQARLQGYPQMPPEMMASGPMPITQGAPPPPYETQAGPPVAPRRASFAGGSLASQPQPSRTDSNDDSEEDGSRSDPPYVPGRDRSGSAPARANPSRKARPKDLSGLE
ncbi:hypothetical protein BJ322DRAFT_817481 [Thelephora terrestris]|uniref:Uncharacterized protein n=1 Tax=Thelephora terrestris TaxID=56493 RepID=A0A9P6L6A3_9AGAM|nr:hypothetical protein BJ322DRAFT_817481 [Thelephora terrestris]